MAKFSKLPRQSATGSILENILPGSRAGPILEKPVLAQLYWEYIFSYCPSRQLWYGTFENSLGNTLCLEGFIATVVFSVFHWWLNENVLYCKPCPKAPLVIKQLLPPIFLFHLVKSFRFFFVNFFDLFSAPGNFMVRKFQFFLNVVFYSSKGSDVMFLS